MLPLKLACESLLWHGINICWSAFNFLFRVNDLNAEFESLQLHYDVAEAQMPKADNVNEKRAL